MMINLKDNSEKDKYILELFQTSPKEAFRLLFDAYHMKLCIYAVQLTDSFEMAEDIVQGIIQSGLLNTLICLGGGAIGAFLS